MTVVQILQDIFTGLYAVEVILASFGKTGVPAKIAQIIKDVLSDEPEINAVVEDPSLGTVIEKGPAIVSDVEKVIQDAKK
jgi:hypothetical protein